MTMNAAIGGLDGPYILAASVVLGAILLGTAEMLMTVAKHGQGRS